MTQYGHESKPTNGTSPGASLLPVSTAAAPSVRVAQPSDCSIEFRLMNTTIRVRGAVDTQALSVVLDCLARRA
jgi:hypothetical protein